MTHLIKSPKNTQVFSSTTKLSTTNRPPKRNAFLKAQTMSNLRLLVTLRMKVIRRTSNGQDLLILLLAILFTLQLHMPDATGILPFTSNGWLDFLLLS